MKRLAEQSLYEILEVPPSAPSAEIEKAYDRVRMMYGPDSLATYTLVDAEEVALLARRIEEARTVLLDPQARAGYDAALAGANGASRPPVPPVTRIAPPVISPAGPLARRAAERAGSGALLAAAAAPPTSPPEASHRQPGPASVAAPETEPPASSPTAAPEPPISVSASAPVALGPAPTERREERSTPRPMAREMAISEGAAWNGELLRQVRESRGISIQQVAERTKVTRHHLENIEADRYEVLPAPVYLRGILMSVAKELRLDGQKVARSYLEIARGAAIAAAAVPSKKR